MRNSVKKNIKEIDLWVKPGDEIHSFTGANEAIGTLVIQCESQDELYEALDSVRNLVQVIVKK